MRILMIPKPEPADAVTSGIGRYVGILEQHFSSDFEVVHLPGAPHAEDRTARVGVSATTPVAVAPSGFLKKCLPAGLPLALGYFRETVALARKLRSLKGKVDIIHVNRVGCEIQTVAAKLAGFKRVLATIHNLPGEDVAAQYWLRRLVERLSFACADHLISVSEATYEAWHQRTGLARTHVTIIHNGMDVRVQDLPSKQVARRSMGISEGVIVIGICARLHPMKGHSVLLDAFAQLVKEHELSSGQAVGSSASEPYTQAVAIQQHNNSTTASPLLLVAGDGPEQANIEAQIQNLGLADHVRMLGRVQDVMGFMRTLDVHVLPSVTLESMPFSVIEAMFAGVPSIVSDVGGAREVVEACAGGQVVPKGDVDALAGCMRDWAHAAELRQEAGARCTAYAQQKLTGKLMSEATSAVYRSLL